jgi:galactitol-specific phosphotransferase system IIC component
MFLLSLKLGVGWIIAMVVVAIVLIATMVVMLILVPFKLWFRALVSSAHISMAKLIGMKMRKVDTQLITLNYITVIHHRRNIFQRYVTRQIVIYMPGKYKAISMP